MQPISTDPSTILLSGPVVIGGIGGSGTRLVAELLKRLNFYIGNDLNVPLDNLAYTLLFKRRKWYYKNKDNQKQIFQGLSILNKRMNHSGGLTIPEYRFLLNAFLSMATHGHNRERDGSGFWPVQRVIKMFNVQNKGTENVIGWGWKEPNTHLLITEMNNYFKSFKYIHVIRHGLDVAHGKNQQQLFNWGPLFGVDFPDSSDQIPVASFQYWVRANKAAITKGKLLGANVFHCLNYDHLCNNPREEIKKLTTFLNVTVSNDLFETLCGLPKVPESARQYKNFSLDRFSDRDLSALGELGFSI